ncbi:glycosyl hydrolase family 61-domain-containing protein [Auriculariales sp. MPI-PUGE-AT-0066]|nr:glycosyl hydrolase family 61-domain-containing protein [Auriculariales sp. MPI-PUGE-AT-0066]
MFLTSTLSLLAVSLLVTQVSAHGFVSNVRVDGGDWQKAQKTGASFAFREVSKNTGWIGSNFLQGNKGIICGASDTPFKTVAQPGGTFFSDASQGAQGTLDVNAGSVVTVAISGNPGDGFPHPKGHVQVWLARCGDSHDACKGFDASNGGWFKILGEKDGIQNTLRQHYNGGLDGHTYDIKLPTQIKGGSYIMRFELIAFGQSSQSEGGQDQYYPWCGQMFIKGGSSAPNYKTVMFPFYGNGNIDQGTLPGPTPLELTDGGAEDMPPSTGTEAGPDNGPSPTAPECASMCFGVKVSEHSSLASSCGASDVACMCQKQNFHSAFNNCSKDHCGSDLDAALGSFESLCAAGAKMMRRAAKRDSAARRRSSLLSHML